MHYMGANLEFLTVKTQMVVTSVLFVQFYLEYELLVSHMGKHLSVCYLGTFKTLPTFAFG